MRNLTIKQAEILEYIRLYIRDKRYSPSIREISERFNITVKCGQDHVSALVRKGFIVREEGKARTIRIVERDK